MNFIRFYTVAMLSLIFVFSCGDDDNDDDAPAEFVAEVSDFEGYTNWDLIGTYDSTLVDLGTAHTNEPRSIWINRFVDPGPGEEYPQGTILIKRIGDADNIIQLVAMAKRGGNFNQNHNGWEWFELSSTGAINTRGAIDACNNCHATSRELDYTFH